MKKTFGFAVQLNQEQICRAGFEEAHAVTTCILSSVRRKGEEEEELTLSIGGLNSDRMEYVDWDLQNLKIGDEILIKVIDSDFDPPTKIRKEMTEEEIIQRKLEHFHRLKEELKDYLED